MRVACVIVHYHTPELACRAIESVRSDAAASGIEADVLVVDNGSDEEARQRLASADARVVRPDHNLGYAGGVNLGVSQTTADPFVVMNADVEVIPGCLARLVDALRDGSAAAGPRMYLDRTKRFLLPPAEVHTRAAELLRRLAVRGDAWARRARRSWRRHARRYWLAELPLHGPWLNGALLAIRRHAWESAGPFDDTYQLYFEEVDWLLRLRRRGLRSTYVPQAEAFHWYNRSAALEPAAAQWFAESARRFAERHYGATFVKVVGRIGARGALVEGEPTPLLDGVPSIPIAGRGARAPLWVELSSNRLRFPAAGAIVRDPNAGRWSVDADLWNGLAPGRWVLTLVDANGVEREAHEFVREAPQPHGVVTRGPSAYRAYAAGDEESINRGFNAAFGLQRPLDEWRWKFSAEPEGRWILVAVSARNEVVAHFGAVPVRFQVDGKVFLVGQLVDLFCLRRPDFAHAGVFAHLGREFFRLFGGPRRLALLFGFPGERSLGIGRAKLDYGDPVPIPVWRRAAAGERDPPTGYTVREGFDAAAVDRLWRRAACRYPVAAVRDAAWLARRFTGRAGVDYLHLGAWSRDDVHAWAVLRLQDGIACWAELVWDGEDPRALLALDDAAAHAAREWGATALEMWLANDPSAEAVLASRGWSSELHPHAMLTAKSFEPGVDANDVARRFYITMGDADLV